MRPYFDLRKVTKSGVDWPRHGAARPIFGVVRKSLAIRYYAVFRVDVLLTLKTANSL